MRFKHTGHAIEFAGPLHPKVREVAMRLDSWMVSEGLGQLMITDVSRRKDFYRRNKLKEPKFSWHYVDCAIDFRKYELSELQQARLEAWLRQEVGVGGEWQFVSENHGTADHWHLAYMCFLRRRAFEKGRYPPGEFTPPDGTTIPKGEGDA